MQIRSLRFTVLLKSVMCFIPLTLQDTNALTRLHAGPVSGRVGGHCDGVEGRGRAAAVPRGVAVVGVAAAEPAPPEAGAGAVGAAAAPAVRLEEHVAELLASEHVHEEVGGRVDARRQVGQAHGHLDEPGTVAHRTAFLRSSLKHHKRD